MPEEEPFDLSKFLTDSLILKANAVSPTKMMYPSTIKDSYSKLSGQDPLELLGEKSFGQPINISEDIVGTTIQEFFRGANIFITGGTGFIGKILTEKLIRSISHISQIYLLIRAKRGKTSQERFEQLLQDPVFLRMKVEVPEYGSKITSLNGDISEPNLGLSATDHQLVMDRINVVFHSAADVRFIEPLKAAIAANVLGSKRVLDLAKCMKHLKCFVHVSTAYSQCVRRVIEENVPKMSVSYQEVLNFIEANTDKGPQVELPRILQGWPNTYTFSKAVCEDMVQEEAKGLPICIFRPSAVIPTYKEPVRGWTDNINGPCGLFLGGAMGVLHCLRIDEELSTDLVPVDYVVNCMIAAAWKTAICRDRNDLPVYNFTSTPVKPMCWKTIFDCAEEHQDKWPLSQAIWYPFFIHPTSYILDELAHIFLHTIPGKVFDTLAIMAGQRPRLSKVYERLKTLKTPLHYFTSTVWEFKNDNVMNLWGILSEEDKTLFHFDVRNVDFMEHLIVSTLGVRYYFLKEKMESIPAAKRKNICLFWAHNCLKLVSGVLVLKLLVCVANVLPI